MKPSNNLENKTPYETYWRVQLICKKVPARSFLEPPLEYNQDQKVLRPAFAVSSAKFRKFFYEHIRWLLLTWAIAQNCFPKLFQMIKPFLSFKELF